MDVSPVGSDVYYVSIHGTTIPYASCRRRDMEDIEFVRETTEDPAARTTTELTGWELVVFELADEEEPGE